MHTLKSKKILIVDDQPGMRRFVEASFRQAGVADIFLGENGNEALDIARSELPDLIVMDMSMPQASGLSTLRQLKQLSGTAGIPVIIISGGDFRQMSSDDGSIAVLSKPFTSRQILDEAERLLHAQGEKLNCPS